MDRLRELGYPVHALRGTAGYRLGAGASLPPLLLDDDEAVAVVVGLRSAAGGSVAGIEETSLRALTKLEQVLPARLRDRVNTLHTATVRAGIAPGPRVSPEVLMAIAEACRRHEQLRFDYTSLLRDETARRVEPHTLVNWGRHWYLVAWDLDRGDWRTFRVDRLTPKVPTGPRFTPREPPDGDVTAYLANQLSTRAAMSRWRSAPPPSASVNSSSCAASTCCRQARRRSVSDGAGEVVAVGACVQRVRPGDRVAARLFPGWQDDPRLLFAAAATVRAVAVGSGTQFTDMNRTIAAHGLRPVIDRVFPFEEAAAAYRYYESENPFGKVVITTGADQSSRVT